jgi:glycosyltransferase involved in cell wall biosynthesis
MVVWMAHADYQFAWGDAAAPDHYIANAGHVATAGPPGTWIMRPHVDAMRTTAAANGTNYVTLIGASELKGIAVFRRIARALPHRRFLVVQSAFDRQRVAPGTHGNLTIRAPTIDMAAVYASTRILCVPSVESWGRVAVEAAHNGIPTIAHPSPGLDESMGDAYLPADRGDVSAWLDAIRYLDIDDAMVIAIEAAADRAATLDALTRGDRDDIIRRLEAIA